MSPPYFPFPQSAGPIPVDGGIRAKSKRGAIGEQWWSRRFIAVLETLGMSGRLQRGRNYARKGQVLEFSLTQGKVTAQVQGSRPKPYRVTIGVLPLTSSQWREVERRLASQALFRAKLLAGEMPAEIEQVFADCGTPYFPGRPPTLICTAAVRTGRCPASTSPRCVTCSPRHSTTTRSRCSPGMAGAVTRCSQRCAGPVRGPLPGAPRQAGAAGPKPTRRPSPGRDRCERHARRAGRRNRAAARSGR